MKKMKNYDTFDEYFESYKKRNEKRIIAVRNPTNTEAYVMVSLRAVPVSTT